VIEHNKPTLGKQEQQAVSKVLESGYISQGLEVEKFENEFCDFLGLPEQHAVALSSGTSALFMALWSLNAKNKSIAIPVYACSALRNAVAMAQAKEILIDNAVNSPNICLEGWNIFFLCYKINDIWRPRWNVCFKRQETG
jgi:perosamine synthetase